MTVEHALLSPVLIPWDLADLNEAKGKQELF
jgi:hypothetical protein